MRGSMKQISITTVGVSFCLLYYCCSSFFLGGRRGRSIENSRSSASVPPLLRVKDIKNKPLLLSEFLSSSLSLLNFVEKCTDRKGGLLFSGYVHVVLLLFGTQLQREKLDGKEQRGSQGDERKFCISDVCQGYD